MYKCKKCDYETENLSKLANHYQFQHPIIYEQKIICDKCKKEFKNIFFIGKALFNFCGVISIDASAPLALTEPILETIQGSAAAARVQSIVSEESRLKYPTEQPTNSDL